MRTNRMGHLSRLVRSGSPRLEIRTPLRGRGAWFSCRKISHGGTSALVLQSQQDCSLPIANDLAWKRLLHTLDTNCKNDFVLTVRPRLCRQLSHAFNNLSTPWIFSELRSGMN